MIKAGAAPGSLTSPLEREGGTLRSAVQNSTPLPVPPPQGGRGPRGESTDQSGLSPKQQQKRREKRDVDGWIVLDKPTGMTSTHAVSVVKRAFAAKKAGHAGTLDPLASGILPIALGEATKTVPFVMEGRKAYRFTVRWGVETDTDDAEGRAIGESLARPSVGAIRAALPAFVGEIMQTPPKYSALKIDGERAYDLAREGEEFTLEPRLVDITRLDLVSVPDADHAEFGAECGKGTYVRALARDLGRTLGTLGHVIALRRTAVGPFAEADAVGIERLVREAETPPLPANAPFLLPVETGLGALPALTVSRADAARLGRGQAVLIRGRDAPVMDCRVAVSSEGVLVALADAAEGELRPRRIFRLRQGT